MLRLPPTTRLIIGAALGAAAWPVLSVALPFLPEPVRFLLAWSLFTFGPGVAVGGRVTRDLDSLTRVIVVLGTGSAAAAVLIDLLGRAHWIPVFPVRRLRLRLRGACAVGASPGCHASRTRTAGPAHLRGARGVGGRIGRAGLLAPAGFDTGRRRRALWRLRLRRPRLLRVRGIRSLAHGPADGGVLLRP